MSAGTPAEVAAVLASYFPPVMVDKLRVTAGPQGFSGASVWKVEAPAATFALRRWPQNGLPPERLHGLHQLLQHLSDAGLTFVASPVRSRSGETLIAVNDRFWQLEPWLPGAADFRANPTDKRLSAAMSTLARWHTAARTFRPDTAIRTWFASNTAAPSPAVSERLARWWRFMPTEQRSLRDAIAREPDAARRDCCANMIDCVIRHRAASISQLESLSRQPFALQPCLRDIWHDHVLFTGDAVTGLIDASACRTENVATDLARLLGSLVEDETDRWQFAIAEYLPHRPLTLAEEALMVALDQSGVLLSAMTWLEWLYLERRTFPDRQTVDERLSWLERRLQRLARQSLMW